MVKNLPSSWFLWATTGGVPFFFTGGTENALVYGLQASWCGKTFWAAESGAGGPFSTGSRAAFTGWLCPRLCLGNGLILMRCATHIWLHGPRSCCLAGEQSKHKSTVLYCVHHHQMLLSPLGIKTMMWLFVLHEFSSPQGRKCYFEVYYLWKLHVHK